MNRPTCGRIGRALHTGSSGSTWNIFPVRPEEGHRGTLAMIGEPPIALWNRWTGTPTSHPSSTWNILRHGSRRSRSVLSTHRPRLRSLQIIPWGTDERKRPCGRRPLSPRIAAVVPRGTCRRFFNVSKRDGSDVRAAIRAPGSHIRCHGVPGPTFQRPQCYLLRIATDWLERSVAKTRS